MKLIIAIIHDEDSLIVTDELNRLGISVTKLCSSGGFLKAGNTTLVIGTEDDSVDSVIDVILLNSKSREHGIQKVKGSDNIAQVPVPNPNKVIASGATIFVSHVERFEKF